MTAETVSRGHQKVMHTARTCVLLWFVTHEVIEVGYSQVLLENEPQTLNPFQVQSCR